jgi:hypothetical protein
MPDPRQRDTGAVQGDKPTYEEGSEGSEGSGLSALLEELGIEGEDAEEEFLRREIEVQKAHEKLVREETQRHQQYNEEEDRIVASQIHEDVGGQVEDDNDDFSIAPDVD